MLVLILPTRLKFSLLSFLVFRNLTTFWVENKMAKYLRMQYRHWTLWCDRCHQCITPLLEDHSLHLMVKEDPWGRDVRWSLVFIQVFAILSGMCMLVNIDGELLQFVKSHIIFMFLPLLWKNLRNIWNVANSVMFKSHKIHFQEYTVILKMSHCFLLKLSFPVFLIMNPLTLYTLSSVCIFSLLFSKHFLPSWQREFGKQSRAFLVGDHFLYFCDLNVCHSGGGGGGDTSKRD